ncbi:DUF1643 domain-containing protein [Silvibacterium acidisoli]|uniref:DUF1643 domain-containing protein n=1 Tax=Acidobacteriaceae bacterium ZG23-2 TaxID=2883246 RepID=UPI00406CF36D
MAHDPGGKVLLPLPLWVKGSAIFGGMNDEYRYQLKRVWDEALPSVLFVMMNPSTADPMFDDPTVAKCRRYATDWGFGTLLVGNTFAYRATDQRELASVDPFGPDNLNHLLDMAEMSAVIIFAYGLPHRSIRNLGAEYALRVRDAYPEKAHVLKLCADGTPSHPLYLKGDLRPIPWRIDVPTEQA